MTKTRSADDFPHKKIAKIDSTMLGLEDHGILTFYLFVSYGGMSQGIGGFGLDNWDETAQKRVGCAWGMESISRVLLACGAGTWEKLKGRTVYVLFADDSWSARPIGIAPLPTEEGELFLFDDLKHMLETK